MRVRRRVRILPIDLCFRRGVRIGSLEQSPPHDPTDQVEFMPGLPERLAETRERSWNLEFPYVGHHNDQILVRDGLRVRAAPHRRMGRWIWGVRRGWRLRGRGRYR